MQRRSELRYFAVMLAVMAVALLGIIKLRVVEHLSYAVERGRLRAVREALPSPALLDERTRTVRAVADVVAPAVVSILTERDEPGAVADSRYSNDSDNSGEPVPRDIFTPGETHSDGLGPLEDHLDLPDSHEDGRSLSFFPPMERGLGSGFIFNAKEGYVLTASHVIDGADRIRLVLADGREVGGEVLGADPDSDLAVIRIDLDQLHELPLADSSAVAIGDEVLAVGSPFGLRGTFSKGIISGLNRRDISANQARYRELLQTDAVINPGNSGGPLVNLRGEVVGVNTAIATTTGQYDGVGFAIPANLARELIDDLIDGGPAFLGVLVGDVAAFREETLALGWTKPYGAWVDEVLEGLAAQRGGIQPGDVIVEIDSRRIDTIRRLGEVVGPMEPGTEIRVKVWRDAHFETIPIRLGRRYAPH